VRTEPTRNTPRQGWGLFILHTKYKGPRPNKGRSFYGFSTGFYESPTVLLFIAPTKTITIIARLLPFSPILPRIGKVHRNVNFSET
jgi:hypothetical protein